ncbi:Hypothetical predicted protein, partial [Paramuricea clavata]
SGCNRTLSFTNCKSFSPAVNVNDIETIQILNKTSDFPTLRMKVQWKVPKAGNSNIWGWQIILANADSSELGFHQCIQVNRKFIWESDIGDLYVNYTFDEIRLGAKLKIQIQGLPAMDMNKGVEKKILTKDLK